MTTSWHTYPSIFALGHRALAELFLDPVTVEEKIDGSQFSFGLFEGEDELFLRVRSKGAEMYVEAPEKMFQAAVKTVNTIACQLTPGWTYRAEYLAKPHHNALAYDRVPAQHLILFDVNPGHEEYLPWAAKAEEAARLGLEVVPLLFAGVITDMTQFRAFLESPSVLGGQKIEGVVVKNYARFGADKKVLMGKFVSEAFRETHHRVWTEANPQGGGILNTLGARLTSPARWQKAVQHLREAGHIQDAPQDIGLLMREVWPDIEKEEREAIQAELYAWAAPHLRRHVTRGLPEWYKEQLLRRQFEQETIPS